jgi:hypothetical protein
LHTWHPEDGWDEHTKIAEDGFWWAAAGDASVIVDYVDGNGANASGHYTEAQSVDHIKVVSSSFHSASAFWDVPPYIGRTTFDVRSPFPMGRGDFASDYVCPPPPTGKISDFSLQCWDEMCSMFPPEFDALSFLVELKSLAELWETFKDIADVLKDLEHRRLNIRKAASAHAGVNFGVSPLLGDTASIYNTFKRVRKRIEWLLSNREKWVRVGSTTSFEVKENTFCGQFGYSGWSPGVQLLRTRQVHKLTSTARAKFTYPNVEPWLMFVRGVIQDSGFDTPLSSWWELTPFSWCVDYFGNVAGFLKRSSITMTLFGFVVTLIGPLRPITRLNYG